MSDEPVVVRVCFQNDALANEFFGWLIDKVALYMFVDSLYRRDWPDVQCSWDEARRVINVQVVPNDEQLS